MPLRTLAVFLGAALILTVALTTAAATQNPVTLKEVFLPDKKYTIELKVEISGRMVVPDNTKDPKKDAPPRIVTVTGKSTLKYDERVLPPDDVDTDKVIRSYRLIEIKRTIGDRDQEANIRNGVRRMVVLRSAKGKAPFSPDGPLTWGEIDVIRTDIFCPALIPSLLPNKPVRPGESWPVSADGIRELTDLERVTAGGLTMKFIGIVRLQNRDYARLELTGTVKGVDDMGPGQHTIDGTGYFDVAAGALTYLSLKATRDLLDGTGKVVGRIDGRFTLARTLNVDPPDLSDAALRTIDLSPTPDNSQLLYDNPDLGVRFLYPRRWRVGAVQGRQVTLDGPNGAGILLTVEPMNRLPAVDAYRAESEEFLRQQKATISNISPSQRVADRPLQLDRFGLDAEIAGEAVRMEYAVLTQAEGGVTIAARLPKADAAALTADVDRVLRKLMVTKRIEGK
jgi:hypothetical protein